MRSGSRAAVLNHLKSYRRLFTVKFYVLPIRKILEVQILYICLEILTTEGVLPWDINKLG